MAHAYTAEAISHAALCGVRPIEHANLVDTNAASLLVIDGNPLDDLGLLQDQGRHMPVIMQAGKLHKNLL